MRGVTKGGKMNIFGKDTFDIFLLDLGAKQIKKESGFFSSLEKSILSGLINALSNLILNSKMFNKIIGSIFGGKIIEGETKEFREKGIILMVLEMIADFLVSDNPQKLERLIDIVISYMDNDKKRAVKENENTVKIFTTKEKIRYNI